MGEQLGTQPEAAENVGTTTQPAGETKTPVKAERRG